MSWPADCPRLPPHCDCAHPGECLFAAPTPERPSPLLVWIMVAVALAVVILAVVLL